jgi:hypothetical protein
MKKFILISNLTFILFFPIQFYGKESMLKNKNEFKMHVNSLIQFSHDFELQIYSHNVNGLEKYIEFPLRVKGFLDNYPQFSITINTFYRFFSFFLLTEYHDNFMFIELFSAIFSDSFLKFINDEIFYINDVIKFQYKNHRWKIITIYFDTQQYMPQMKNIENSQ